MNQYKLIVSDLDGTLLGTDLKMSRENYQAIKELDSRGTIFVPATGRTLCEMEEIFALPEVRYAIYSNGAVLHDKITGEKIVWDFEGELRRFVISTLLQYDTFMVVHINGRAYADGKKAENLAHYHVCPNVEDVVANVTVLLENFETELPDGAVECFVVFFADDAEMKACQNTLLSNPEVKAAETWPHNLEIFYKDAGKGNALEVLAEKLNIEMRSVIAIGDSHNDMQMISLAGLGLATENGRAPLKEAADAIVCHNDAHVMQYVKTHYFDVCGV